MVTSTSSRTSSRTCCRPSTRRQYPSYALDSQVDLPGELATLDGRLAGAGLPADHPLRAAIPQLLAGYGALQAATRIGGANALATLPDGSRAIVLSYTNAGKVTERGVEVGLGYQLTPEFRGDVTFTGFDFTVKSQAVGDQLVPNTPSKKASSSLSYAGQQGVDANVTVRLVDGYQWAAGVFQGYVPSNEFVNVSAGYRVNNYFRIHATATNLFDQKRFQLYGGSVIGRRVLGGITAASGSLERVTSKAGDARSCPRSARGRLRGGGLQTVPSPSAPGSAPTAAARTQPFRLWCTDPHPGSGPASPAPFSGTRSSSAAACQQILGPTRAAGCILSRLFCSIASVTVSTSSIGRR